MLDSVFSTLYSSGETVSVSSFLLIVAAALALGANSYPVVLPNNANIVLTAQQAAQLYDSCPVHVIPTKSIVEGYSALSMMNLWSDTVEELIEDMSMSLGSVTTGYVTTAIRDTHMDGLEVKKGDYIGRTVNVRMTGLTDEGFSGEIC